MSFHHRVSFAGLALSAVAAAVSQAANAPDDELQEVIVSARSLEVSAPLELSRYGYDVEFIGREQIENHGFVDVSQALEMLVPGAFVATQAGAFSYVNLALQGSRGGDVLWTVDGVRINNRLYNSTSPADTLPASMIERVEVLKGGQGLLYGTQAVAGVVNVVTRAFSDELGGGVSLGTAGHDGLNLDGHLRGALGGHRFVAWASKNESDGYSLYDAYQPNTLTRNRAYDVKSFGLRYGFDFTDELRLTLQGVHTEAALDYPNPARTDVNDRNEETLSGRLDFSPSENVDVFLKGYFHDWDTDYYPSTNPDASAYWGYKDFGLSAASRFDLQRGLEYHVGYDLQRYRGRDEVLLIDGLTEEAHAVYAQVRTTDDLSTRARMTAGVRYNDAGGASDTIWSASGVYDLTDSLFIEGSAGTSFLLPDAYQLFAIDPFDTRGNPDLEPERSFNVNLAIGGTLPTARPLGWQLSGWRRQVKNLITDDDTAPPAGFDSVFINVDGKVKVTGGEALVRGRFSDALGFDLSYLYSRELGANGRQLQNRPRQSVKLGLQLAPGGRWGADLALKYVGTMYTNVTGFPQERYGKDVIANLGAHVFLDGAARQHRVGVRIENLFDTEYVTRIRSAAWSGTPPAGSPARLKYSNLGAPRTVSASYSYSF